jgi:uncharacterized protein YciI
MLAIAILTYVVPIEQVLANIADHRAYLAELEARGKLIASGPFVPRTGGALLLHPSDEEELAQLIASDPFSARKIATYDTKVWAPTIGGDALEDLAMRSTLPSA